MEDIIRQVYAQWRIAKEQARQECDSRFPAKYGREIPYV